VDTVAVTAGRIARFPNVMVMARRHGPVSSDDRVDDTDLGRGEDGGRGGGVVPGAVVKVKEEWDDSVPGRGGEG
jgi:hypothetical protein